MILAAVKVNGSVNQAHCANSISKILSKVPGFENIGVTYFPKALSADFGSYPNVSMQHVTDANVDTSHGITFLEPKEYNAMLAKRAAQ
jgi:copper chaperone CopZ